MELDKGMKTSLPVVWSRVGVLEEEFAVGGELEGGKSAWSEEIDRWV